MSASQSRDPRVVVARVADRRWWLGAMCLTVLAGCGDPASSACVAAYSGQKAQAIVDRAGQQGREVVGQAEPAAAHLPPMSALELTGDRPPADSHDLIVQRIDGLTLLE